MADALPIAYLAGEFLPIEAEIPIRPAVESNPLEAENKALNDLRAGHVRGAKVLRVTV